MIRRLLHRRGKKRIPEFFSLVLEGATNSSVSLSWTESRYATSYRLQRMVAGGTSWSTLASNLTVREYVDNNVSQGTEYEYRVTASNAAGNTITKPLRVKVGVDLPGIPTGLSITNVTHNSLNLSWSASQYAAYYRVERRLPPDNWRTAFDNVTTTSVQDTGLTEGTYYEYRVVAINEGGSIMSKVVNVTTPVVMPGAASNLQFSNITQNSLTISWSAGANAEYYRLERRLLPSGSWKTAISVVNGTSANDSGLVGGSSYEYRVVSINAGGSVISQPKSVTMGVLSPTYPTNLRFQNVTENSVRLLWDAGQNVDHYRVQRRLAPSGSWGTVKDNVTNLFLDDTGLTGGQTYEYRVYSVNAAGHSLSQPVSVQTVDPKPDLSGGDIHTYESGGKTYRVHIFRSSAQLVVNNGGVVEALVVAGGGGGGYFTDQLRGGGGGGAGGVLHTSNLSLSTGASIPVTVGIGGAGGSSGLGSTAHRYPGNGEDSSIQGYLTAIGGGSGGNGTNEELAIGRGGDGGSGGGGAPRGMAGGSGTTGQGYAGGGPASSRASGGGGGAGSAGTAPPSSNFRKGGNGGQGRAFSITGTSQYYASGGAGYGDGGVEATNPQYGYGEVYPGGGGIPGQSGEDNTGGGGGGSTTVQGTGGKGGSGVVIIRYEI